MIMAFTIDTRSALIFVAVIAALSLVVFGIMAVNIPMMRGVQAALERVLGATRENLSGARVIRAFCKEDEQFAEFVEKNRALTAKQKRAGLGVGTDEPADLSADQPGHRVADLHRRGAGVARRADAGRGRRAVQLHVADSGELIKLANLIVTMNKAAASWNRIADALAIQPDMTSPEVSAPAVTARRPVQFDHVA